MHHKIKKFLHKNFTISGVFSSHEFDQTDFVGIYFNMPEITEHPKTIEELATTLKHYNKIDRPVKIRNTGHSVNGQTLTDGVQICLQEIRYSVFNKSKMEVVVGCGTPWNDIFKSIRFPNYCTPVFTNNPNQEIRVGGTISVGGVGPTSSKYGGMWNNVKSLKLVTMQGEILECSLLKNPEYFKYAIGGFGRIGVIGEVTLEVVKSQKDFLMIGFGCLKESTHIKNLDLAMEDLSLDIVGAAEHSWDFIKNIHLADKYLIVGKEIGPQHDIESLIEAFKKRYDHSMMAFAVDSGNGEKKVDISTDSKKVPKYDIVYWYPTPVHQNQLEIIHPWSDCVIGRTAYPEFLEEVKKLIYKYNLDPYLVRHSLGHGKFEPSLLGSYPIRKINSDPESFPLSLDIKGEEKYSIGIAIEPNVLLEKLDDAIKLSNEVSDLVYRLGGKKYLYALHSLKKSQVEQHFTRPVIHQWQKIKDELDPKHLLNIGVIEHLD